MRLAVLSVLQGLWARVSWPAIALHKIASRARIPEG